jgi:hypothetical protein
MTFDQWARRWAVLSKTGSTILGASYNNNHYVFMDGMIFEYHNFVALSSIALHLTKSSYGLDHLIANTYNLNVCIFANGQKPKVAIMRKKLHDFITNHAVGTVINFFKNLEEQLVKNTTHVPLQQQLL